MATKLFWKRAVGPIAIGVVACLGFTMYWVFIREREGAKVVPQPTSHIRFLRQDERLRPVEHTSANVYTYFASPPLPVEQVDNPVLFADRFAVVRFQNETDKPLIVYDLGQSLDTERVLRHAFIVEVEVRDASGNVLDGKNLELDRLMSFVPPTVPSADVLLSRSPRIFSLQPAESIELPMSILGKVGHPRRGLKPGTYTVRATVSYAEAPTGETKRITSEPVTVTVTEDHIKAAEAYWAAANK